MRKRSVQQPLNCLKDFRHLDQFQGVPLLGIEFEEGLVKIKASSGFFPEGNAWPLGRDDLSRRSIAENSDGRHPESQRDMEKSRIVANKQVRAAEDCGSLGERGLSRQVDEARVPNCVDHLLRQDGLFLCSQQDNSAGIRAEHLLRQADVPRKRPAEVLTPMRSRVKGHKSLSRPQTLSHEGVGKRQILMGYPANNALDLRTYPQGAEKIQILLDDWPVGPELDLHRVEEPCAIVVKPNTAGRLSREDENRILEHPLTPCRINDQVEGVSAELLHEPPFSEKPAMAAREVVEEGFRNGLGYGKQPEDRVRKRRERDEGGVRESMAERQDQRENPNDISDSASLKDEDPAARFHPARTVEAAPEPPSGKGQSPENQVSEARSHDTRIISWPVEMSRLGRRAMIDGTPNANRH